NEDRDYVKYVDHILRATQKLDSLYRHIQNEPLESKTLKKRVMIERIVNAMDTLTLTSGKKPSGRFKELPNNAYFMSFIHYQSNQDELMHEWKQTFDGVLKAYIQFLSARYPYL